MNRRHFVGLIAVAPLSGCAFFKGNLSPESRIALAAQAAQAATQLAVINDLTDNPGHRPAYVIALETIALLLKSEDYDEEKLISTLSALPVGKFGNQLFWAGIVSVMHTAVVEIMDVTSDQAVAAVMQAIKNGLDMALAGFPESVAAKFKVKIIPEPPIAAPKSRKHITI